MSSCSRVVFRAGERLRSGKRSTDESKILLMKAQFYSLRKRVNRIKSTKLVYSLRKNDSHGRNDSLLLPDRKPASRKDTLLGAGLRRDELAQLQIEDIQQREGRWCLIDITGKGKRIRTVPIPAWTKEAVDTWLEAMPSRSSRARPRRRPRHRSIPTSSSSESRAPRRPCA